MSFSKKIHIHSVNKIGNAAFHCFRLKSIIIDDIKEIGHFTFKGSYSLEEIVLPNTLEKIGLLNFSKDIKSIKFNGTIAEWNNVLKGIGLFDSKKVEIICNDGTVLIENNNYTNQFSEVID